MKSLIKEHLNNPAELEKLYRENKSHFEDNFKEIYPEIKGNELAKFWIERLNYQSSEISWGSKYELIFIVVLSIVAGLIAKIPYIFGLSTELFYSRNISFIAFPLIATYFIWKQQLPIKKIYPIYIAFILSIIYLNYLPNDFNSNSIVLACIHMAVFSWSILGFTFTAKENYSLSSRLNFLRYNGELVVMTALILISGGILTGITIGLFEVIGIDIKDFYIENIAIYGLAACTIVATYIIQTNPQLVNKVSPVIAKIFSPLVLITLIVYLIAIFSSGKDPYKDREFLIIFNALLLGVMAIIFFSIAEVNRASKSKASILILFLLAALTILVNSIALSAILYRINEMGITPNRIAVLGGNALILINLILVEIQLFKTLKGKSSSEDIENAIASFLPIYSIWTLIVALLFPLLFGMK